MAQLSDSRLFRTFDPESVIVRDIDEKDGRLEMTLQSRHLGDGKLTFVDSTNWPPQVWQDIISLLFVTDTSEQTDRFVGNTDSMVVHFRGCNHLPHPDRSTLFRSVAAARETGYTPCNLCFKRFPRYSGFDVEQTIAAFQAASARTLGPPHMSAKAQEDLQRVGRGVLENWPSPLRGYDYRFVVLDSPQPNAFAIADGQIYVTSSLLRSLEGDNELAAVLAHEIAHVEMRHTWRKVRAARKASLWSALAIGLTAAVTKSQNVTQLAASLSEIASNIVLTGYGRDMEEEADSFASIYFEHQGNAHGSQAIVQALSKLMYSQQLLGRDPGDKGGFLASHPDLPDRIAKVRHTSADVAPSGVFEGVNSEGEVVATVQFQWQRHYPRMNSIDGGYELMSLVDTTPVLGEKRKIKDIRVKTEFGWIKLDNKEDMEVEPGESVGPGFVAKNQYPLIREIHDIDLGLNKVAAWRLVPDLDTDMPRREATSAPNAEPDATAQTPPPGSESGINEIANDAHSDEAKAVSAEFSSDAQVVGSSADVMKPSSRIQTSTQSPRQATDESIARQEVTALSVGSRSENQVAADDAIPAVSAPESSRAYPMTRATSESAPTSQNIAGSPTSVALSSPPVEHSTTRVSDDEPRSAVIPPVAQGPGIRNTSHEAAEPTPSDGETAVLKGQIYEQSAPTNNASLPLPSEPANVGYASEKTPLRGRGAAGPYFVQVGAFKRSEQTGFLSNQLATKNYPTIVVPGGDYFRVLVGPFEIESEALDTKDRLERQGHSGYVRKDIKVP